MSSSTTIRHWLLLAIGLGPSFAFRAKGCGPDFPNSYLSNSFDELATLPALSFERELERLAPPGRPSREPEGVRQMRFAAAEMAEVRAALADAGCSPPEIEQAVTGYQRDHPPARLPLEFHLYGRGAQAWHDHRMQDAVSAWRELLALPAGQRHYRTVWAAYMIGRVQTGQNPSDARAAYRLAQAAAAHGFADSQELNEACVGWIARTYLRERRCAEALHGYLQQFSTGEPSAMISIQLTLQQVFRGDIDRPASEASASDSGCDDTASTDDRTLRTLAADPQLRSVVTAWLAARGGPCLRWGSEAAHYFGRWIRCLPSADDLSPEEANRWAWAAYQNGMWNEAGALTAKAPSDAPASEWVRAMLLLRSGFVTDAATHLATAARSFARDRSLAEPPIGSSPWDRVAELQPLGDVPLAQLAGLRGVLALRREQYAEALRVFMRSRHWSDAAYVAERVLTIDELIKFVRAEYPHDTPRQNEFLERRPLDLRHLLARRLVRAGRFDDAIWFFPTSLRGTYLAYIRAVRLGWDGTQSTGARATSLWAAAQIMHDHGMELQGTTLEPDFSLWDGEYTWPVLATTRGGAELAAARVADDGGEKPLGENGGLGPTAGERRRVALARIPTRRGHYRYRAAEVAWLAAELLPNDDEQTALILNTGGCWIGRRDPETATRYYQALVLRCANTNLGRAAAAHHWLLWNYPTDPAP